METHRETIDVGVKRRFFSGKLLEKQVGVFLDKTDSTQEVPGDLIVEDCLSAGLLKRYLKNLGSYRKGRHRRCISRKLNRITTSSVAR